MYKRVCFFPPYFPRTLSVFEFIAFVLDFLCSFMEITVIVRQSLFVLELRQLFYGHLAIQYTCWQLSRLRRESHTCGLKTLISRRLTHSGQFLTPD